MTRADAKAFHFFAAVGLALCAACPLIEIICRSNDCIFLSGHDTETTLAVILILMELTVACLKLTTALLPSFSSLLRVFKGVVCAVTPQFLDVVPTTGSPPWTMRI
jgi:hypothetical protein